MSKYTPLWEWIKDNALSQLKLTFTEIENILAFPIDHSFLNVKKELAEFGYKVAKISMKEQSIIFEKIN